MRLPRLLAALALGLVVAVAPDAAWAESPPPPATVPMGVAYTPNHSWEFPEYGGYVDLAGLHTLRTSARNTYKAAYDGIDIAPLAFKHGLKVYLGIDWPVWAGPSESEIDAAVRAILDYGTATVEVILLGSYQAYQDFGTRSQPSVREQIVTKTRVMNEITTRAHGHDVKFGISDGFDFLKTWREDPHHRDDYEQITRQLASVDIIGLMLFVHHPLNISRAWELSEIPTAKLIFLEANTKDLTTSNPCPPTAALGLCWVDASVHRHFSEWRPPPRDSVVRAFWMGAFDDISLPWAGGGSHSVFDRPRRGYFTMYRQRKLPSNPPPLHPGDDPIQQLADPTTYGCEVGMYHRVIRTPTLMFPVNHVRLCMMNGYNFRNPTKFDELSINATCANPSCHLVVRELRKIPSPPECPFHPRMTRQRLDEWILQPFAQLCDCQGLGKKTILVHPDRANPMACSNTFVSRLYSYISVPHWEGQPAERCEDVSKFSVEGMYVFAMAPFTPRNLTQEVLESMCFKPSCELLMYQMATKFDETCTPEQLRRRQWIVDNILKPYYDGCYWPSLLASAYYDTTYRRRKQHPRLPGLPQILDDQITSVSPAPTPVASQSPTMPIDEDDALGDSLGGSLQSDRGPEPSSSRHPPIRKRAAHPSGHPANVTVDDEDSTTAKRNVTTEVIAIRAQSPHASQLPPPPAQTDATKDVGDKPEINSSNRDGDSEHRGLWSWLSTGLLLSSLSVLAFAVMLKRRLRRSVRNEELAVGNAYIAMAGEEPEAPTPASSPTSTLADPLLRSLFVPPGQLRDVRLIGCGGQALVYLVRQTIGPKQLGGETVEDDGLAAPMTAAVASDVSADTRQRSTTGRAYRFLAAKRLPPRMAAHDAELVPDFIAEIKTVAALRHPNIVRLVGVSWTTSFDLQALFEFVSGGDLGKHLSSTPRSPWDQTKLQVAVDVVSALAYVHSLDPPLVHRDIKSRNVLVLKTKLKAASGDDAQTSGNVNGSGNSKKNDSTSSQPPGHGLRHRPRLRAKLTDFGAARRHSAHATMTTGVGTSRWMAPEVIVGGGAYDQRCDVYSFGVLLSELDTHALPFGERLTSSGDLLPDMALLQLIAVDGARPALSDACPNDVRRVAGACLAFDPRERPTARDVLTCLRALLDDVSDRP